MDSWKNEIRNPCKRSLKEDKVIDNVLYLSAVWWFECVKMPIYTIHYTVYLNIKSSPPPPHPSLRSCWNIFTFTCTRQQFHKLKISHEIFTAHHYIPPPSLVATFKWGHFSRWKAESFLNFLDEKQKAFSIFYMRNRKLSQYSRWETESFHNFLDEKQKAFTIF